MITDPFDDPRTAVEMKALLGVRYVCLANGCDWRGYYLSLENDCPRCGSLPHDRWQAHAHAVNLTF